MISCDYNELSSEFIELFNDTEKTLIVVGVIGKSNLANCNKMTCFNLFNCHASFVDSENSRKEGRIKFFHEPDSDHIFVHFETGFDAYILQDLIKNSEFDSFLHFHSEVRTRFARHLLLATQICHIVIFVEPSSSFDASYLTIFKALKIIREQYVMKFLPKLLKNTPIGSLLQKEARLCSPRFIFFFEKSGRAIQEMSSHSIEVEDEIYQMLRTNFIITNNSQLSLFSIPKNKKFLFINTDENLNSDPVVDSLDLLLSYIDGDSEMMQYKPHRGYGVNYLTDTLNQDFDHEKKKSFRNLLMEHVNEAFTEGFDDSISKYRGKNHFVWPPAKTWFEIFQRMHKIFIENPNNENFEARDSDYKAFLLNFHKIMDMDQQQFSNSTKHGYDLAHHHYSDHLPHHYSKTYHELKLSEAVEILYRYARGPEAENYETQLRNECETIWNNGKQQCEHLSLKGNPCILQSDHATSEGSMHSSGAIFISACNCGRTQGRRDDPYTVRKANYEFYQFMAKSCVSCEKSLVIDFPVFASEEGTDFRAAQVQNPSLAHLMLPEEKDGKTPPITDHHLSASQKTQDESSGLSDDSAMSQSEDDDDDDKKESSGDDDGDIEEIVVKIGELDVKEEQAEASKTEYLPGMLLMTSPVGLLPEFSSWSLLCIANSSFYSHNTGLTENQMSGFLSGTNFLLPWDVRCRLEHAKTWAEKYEKNRSRKKQKQIAKKQEGDNANYFTLKIFVGMEYECVRGHRFMMSSNDTVLKGVTGGSKSSGCGSKIVFSPMPLIFPCPCKNNLAQLIRIHVVTPKAPVNICLDPKIKIRRETEMIFVTGFNEPIKLTQSAYWILRLPFVYIGDDRSIQFPTSDVPASTEALKYGFLMPGMFDIKESESDDMIDD